MQLTQRREGAKRFSNENAPDKSRSHPDSSGARAESLCREILRLLMQYDTHGLIEIRCQDREFPLFIALELDDQFQPAHVNRRQQCDPQVVTVVPAFTVISVRTGRF